MRKAHWTETAERTDGKEKGACNPLWGLIGEDEYGLLNVPCSKNYWYGIVNLKNPWHWFPYIRSRLTNKIVFLESV